MRQPCGSSCCSCPNSGSGSGSPLLTATRSCRAGMPPLLRGLLLPLVAARCRLATSAFQRLGTAARWVIPCSASVRSSCRGGQ